jgi:hypothetical protein
VHNSAPRPSLHGRLALCTLATVLSASATGACSSILGLPNEAPDPSDAGSEAAAQTAIDAADGADAPTALDAGTKDSQAIADAADAASCGSNPTNFYVLGKVPCSFPTITEAVAAARKWPGTARTIHVPAGVFSDPQEKFPLDLRGGISLEGAGTPDTTIHGIGDFDHGIEGGGRPGAARATILTGDPTLPSHVSGLRILSGTNAVVGDSGNRSTYGVFCDRGNAVAAAATQPTPNLAIDKITVGASYGAGVVISNSSIPSSGCNARVTSSVFEATNWIGVAVGGCDSNAASSQMALELGHDATTGNTFNNVGEDHGNYGAVWVDGCTASFVARNNKINRGSAGILIEPYADPAIPAGKYLILENQFDSQASAGLRIDHSATIQEVSNNLFQGSDEGGIFVGYGAAQILKARGNTFLGNEFGVQIDSHGGLITGKFDFGTTAEAGGNHFRCNAFKSGGGGNDVAIVGATSGSLLSFDGNFWDHVPPTTSTTDPTDVFLPSSGPPPTLSGAKQALDQCLRTE